VEKASFKPIPRSQASISEVFGDLKEARYAEIEQREQEKGKEGTE